MSAGPITSLEEAAQARVEAVAAVEAAKVQVEETERPYYAAVGRLEAARDRVKQLDSGMAAVKRVHAIGQALADAGIDYDGPPLIAVEAYRGKDVFFLAAVGPGGTGLYVYESRRRGRVDYKRRAVLVEQAARHGVGEEPTEEGKRRWNYDRASKQMGDAGLYAWQVRGRGDFGDGSGSYKPLPPPEGGRWKWLKVREQEELAEATG